jgi:hypothetical protein
VPDLLDQFDVPGSLRSDPAKLPTWPDHELLCANWGSKQSIQPMLRYLHTKLRELGMQFTCVLV